MAELNRLGEGTSPAADPFAATAPLAAAAVAEDEDDETLVVARGS